MTPSIHAAQLDELIQKFNQFAARAQPGDRSRGMTESQASEIATRGQAAIDRLTSPGSAYRRTAATIFQRPGILGEQVERLVGVLQALSKDIENGCLQSFAELVHGELFSDFLDMAHYLVEKDYKDAGAVIAGSSLEGHLRQLAKKSSVDTVRTTTAGGEAPKTAELLNSDLAKAGAYSVTDQKNVTAWLDLRNKAAHGKYKEYEKGQVSIMIDGIRNFITRVPA